MQPSLPIKPGRATTMTHDYKRNDTLNLFAALTVGTGEVLRRTRKRHSGEDVLAFFKWIDLHLRISTCMSCSTISRRRARRPCATGWTIRNERVGNCTSRRPARRGWVAQLTNRRLRNASFDSVAALKDAIDVWASHWNDDPKPFVWHKTAKQIITKVRRGRAALTHHTKSATHH